VTCLSDARGGGGFLRGLGLVLLLLGAPATSLPAQQLGVMGGVGRTFWSGRGVGDTWGITHLALAVQAPLWRAVALRVEAGGGPWKADLGSTGWFSERTTLHLYRIQLSGLARWQAATAEGRLSPFLEGGLGYWARSGCDLDLVGGPGFFGGETRSCAAPAEEGTEDVFPLVPRAGGVTVALGAGARRGAWALGLRYEVGGQELLRGPQGGLGADVLHLTLEWAFRRP
jgi:hypothetical protein